MLACSSSEERQVKKLLSTGRSDDDEDDDRWIRMVKFRVNCPQMLQICPGLLLKDRKNPPDNANGW